MLDLKPNKNTVLATNGFHKMITFEMYNSIFSRRESVFPLEQ